MLHASDSTKPNHTLLTVYHRHEDGCKTAKNSFQLTVTTIILHCEWKKTLFRWGSNVLHDFAAHMFRKYRPNFFRMGVSSV